MIKYTILMFYISFNSLSKVQNAIVRTYLRVYGFNYMYRYINIGYYIFTKNMAKSFNFSINIKTITYKYPLGIYCYIEKFKAVQRLRRHYHNGIIKRVCAIFMITALVHQAHIKPQRPWL